MHQFINFLKDNLNESQYQAVTHKEGSILIVAGAGSGKTRVITARIAYLILDHSVLPSTILALTFTNKAGMEMKERIQHFLGGTSSLPFVGTFHAFCLRILKKHSELLENPFFSILDEDDQHKILHSILVKSGLNKKITAKQVAYQISQIKNQAIQSPQELYTANPFMREVYHAYEQEKKFSKCLDFDDLLLEVIKLFKKHAAFKNDFQDQTRHILIDEYQDTNIVQHELLKHMAQSSDKNLAIDSVCAVGDADQSIYSWRGATVTNIMNFSVDFPKTTVVKLEQNYRSVQPILEVANTVIKNNTTRNAKNLWSEKEADNRIAILSFLSEYQEADSIAYFLKNAIAQKKKLNDIAILYRTHFQSRAIEEALLKHSIPYKIIGGIQFYERKEIKDILAYLKLVVNPFDRPSFFRVINCPLRGLGNKFEELFAQTWQHMPFASFKEVAQRLINNEEVSGTKKDALLHFITLFDRVQHTDTPSNVAEYFIKEIHYFTYLKELYDPEEALSKIDNVKELLQAINHLETQKITTLANFLDEVALMQAQIQAEGNEKDPVLLMTLHAAKGLEFNTVIIAGLEEGLLPSARSLVGQEAIEEERRLFYVGITRAKEHLLLSYSRYRYNFGTMTDQRPSRFVQEIPLKFASFFDASGWNSTQILSFFSQWITGASFSLSTQPKKSAVTISSQNNFIAWKKNQPVQHEKFGIGLIQDIELKGNGLTYLQVKFKSGNKKVDATFCKNV